MKNLFKQDYFGCPECYDTFSDRLDPILRRLQGSVKHVGRGTKVQRTRTQKIEDTKSENNSQNEKENKEEIKDKKVNEKDLKLKKLNDDLKKAIKDERYEDAAAIRDEIKKLQ